MSESSWTGIWSRRSASDVHGDSVLGDLLGADGYDNAQSSFSEDAWREHIMGWADRLGIRSGDSVFEVGCGAGAVLYVLAEAGVRVAGMDLSPGLIATAARAVPDGSFEVGEAVDLPPAPHVDVCLAVGVFMYFPSLDYARSVVAAMAAKATRGVALLDLPDLAKRDASEAFRVDMAGGPDAYRERYAGLEH
ncbi:MAG: class I SAM-dependent methyltransferase, partial [Acidimicrobiales bacterium]